MDDLSLKDNQCAKRSIGDTTIKNISEFAKKNKCSLEIAAKKIN